MQLFIDNGVKHMYRPLDKLQHSFLDFNQPMGLKMNPDNRWVKMADCIPWDEFEIKYAELFPSGTGNVAKPLRMALGALIIQTKFQFADRELVEQITENPYLQYFIGLPGYQEEAPFDASTLVLFRKRITAEMLMEANEYLLAHKDDGRNDNTPPSAGGSGTPDVPKEDGNKGTLTLDATCAPVNIRYPQDIMINRFLLENKDVNPNFTEEELMTIRERDEKRLQTMNFYCNTKECLRTYILRYFGEANQGACGKCGNCQKHYIEKDMTKEAKQVIVCLEELGERYGINVVVGTLLGGKSAKLREYRVDRYPSYASFSKLREQEIKDLIGQMIQEGYLRQTQDKYALLQTTGKAQDLMEDVCTITVKMEPKSSRAVEEDDRIKGTGKRRSDILNTRGLEFFDVLRGLRTSIAREESLPPYLVFSDKTLVDMCVRLPMNREEMMEVNGMGAYKFEKYGERFLTCILENTGGIREKFYFGEIGEVLGKNGKK